MDTIFNLLYFNHFAYSCVDKMRSVILEKEQRLTAIAKNIFNIFAHSYLVIYRPFKRKCISLLTCKSVKIFLQVAKIAQKRGFFKLALFCFKMAHTIHPTDVTVLRQYGESLFQTGKIVESEAIFAILSRVEVENGLHISELLTDDKAHRNLPNVPVRGRGGLFTSHLEKQFNDLKQTAEDFYKSEKYFEAEAYFEAALCIYPDDVSVLQKKAKLHYKQQQYEEARISCKAILELEPNNISHIKNYVILTYQLGYLNETRIYCEKLLEQEPNDLLIVTLYATILEGQGKKNEAMSLFEKVVHAHVEILAIDSFYNQCKSSLVTVLDIDANNIFGLRGCLFILTKKNNNSRSLVDLDQVISFCNRVLELVPDDLFILKHYFDFLVDHNEIELACIISDNLMKDYPENFFALRSKAIIGWCKQELQLTEKYIKAALLIEPTDDTARYLYCACLYRLNKLEEAQVLCVELLKLFPTSSVCLYYHSYILARRKQYDESEQIILRIAKDYLIDKNALEKFVIILLDQQQVQRIVSFVHSCMSLDKCDLGNTILGIAFNKMPDNFLFLRAFAELTQKKCRYDESEAFYKKALEITSNDIECLRGCADVLYRQGKYNDSIHYFKQAIQIDSDDVVTMRVYVEALIRVNVFDEASSVISNALKKHPSDCILLHLQKKINKQLPQ